MQTLETTRTTEEEIQDTQPQELVERLAEEDCRHAINHREICYRDQYSEDFPVEITMGRDFGCPEPVTVYISSSDWNTELDHVSMLLASGEAA